MSLLKVSDLRLGFKGSGADEIHLSSCDELNLLESHMVCLMGANGSGKSTLISAISGAPTLEGKITIFGKDLDQYTKADLAQKIAFVYTDKIDVDYLKVSELVELGRFPYQRWSSKLSEDDKIIINKAIEAMELQPFLQRNLNTLSDGEKQRAMIARAMAQDPKILVLDEPTSYLDLPHKVRTLKLLRDWSRSEKKAVLLSTHDLSLAMKIADTIWLMTPDKKIVSGAPEDLMLGGEIQKTFCTSDIRINPIDGQFELVQEQCININLQGIDCPWTKRALLRNGYGFGDLKNSNGMVLTVVDSDDRYEFKMRGELFRFKTLTDFIDYLRKNANH